MELRLGATGGIWVPRESQRDPTTTQTAPDDKRSEVTCMWRPTGIASTSPPPPLRCWTWARAGRLRSRP